MVAFNTALIFYYVEAIPAYDSLVSNIFNRVAAGELEGWSSVINLSEVLVQPIVSGRNDLQKAYRELLLKSSNFHTVPITGPSRKRPPVSAQPMAFASLMRSR